MLLAKHCGLDSRTRRRATGLWLNHCVDFEPSRTRTCDPLVKSQLLYRLSYRPIYMQRPHSTERHKEAQAGSQKSTKARMRCGADRTFVPFVG